MFENPRFLDSTALNQFEGFILFLSIFTMEAMQNPHAAIDI